MEMEKVNWIPLKESMNGMALKLVIILFITLVVGLIVKFTLARIIKLPNTISNYVSTIVILFIFYKMVIWVLG